MQHNQKCQNRESGVSEVIGAVLLIALVVTAVAIVGVGLLSQPLPKQIPALESVISTSGNIVQITHNGGDTMQKGDFVILVDGVDKTSLFNKDGALTWQSWSPGESLTVPYTNPNSVRIVYTGAGASATLSSANFGEFGVSTTTPTPVPTTTPVPPAPVTAGFTGSPTSGVRPLAVQFTDASTGPVTSRSWTFGDGNTSTVQSPLYTYPDVGTYSVGLTVSNGTGTNTLTRTNYIAVTVPAPAPVTAGFTGTPTSGVRPLAVQFTDASTGPVTSRSWTFGDGNTSTVQSPLYTYPNAGTYSVGLTVSNGSGTNTLTRTNYIAVTVPAPAPVTAGFTGTPTSGVRPLAVQFTDSSTGPVTSRSWTFGDGNTSTVQSPLYTYPSAGTYSVSLTVSNGTGTNTLTRTNYITANLPPAQTIFSDNFDSAFSGWTTSGTTNWYTGSPKSGTHSIQFLDNGMISRTVSTSGYDTISVSFALAGNSLEGAEAVQGQWSPDGSSWNTMGEITNGVLEDNTLHAFTFSVPSGGNNNPTFAIRFRLIGTGNDRGYVDNIVVTGIPL
jgi:flagellin-like protein